MRLQLLTLRKNISNVIRVRKYCGRPRFFGTTQLLNVLARCDAHMNELPIPCLPWGNWYKDKQNLYNKILAFGVFWWLFSFGMMIWTDSCFLNWKPPKQPGPPSDMVEECDDEDS